MSWFGTLRRDRALFALAGCLALLAATLQPLARAAASDGVGAWLICTTRGIEAPAEPVDGSTPDSPPECPLCIAGHACGAAPPVAKALAPPWAAFGSLAGVARTSPTAARETAPSARPCDAPPSIRAPPFCV